MRALVTFVANRLIVLLVVTLVVNAYVQMTGVGRDLSFKGQLETVTQNFRVLADAFR